MCGISGFIGKKELSKETISETLNLMKNRGPDNSDFKKFKCKNIFVYLLHTRLSIIDLSQGSNQPFTAYEKTIIFNGEIYNYIEIRKILKTKGYKFLTNSDTEVLLAAYEEFGSDLHNHLIGMWSFAIWDHKEKKLFVSRDIFGEKPLYYLETSEGFYFGSEIKFIKSLSKYHANIDQSYLKDFIVYGYRVLNKSNRTFFSKIFKLEGSHALSIDDKIKIRKYQYYQPPISEFNISSKNIVSEIRENLLESMRLRLRSDVPISFCLSGGVDSAGLASIASKKFGYNIRTYSIIDCHKNYDETENILSTVKDLSCDHTSIELNYSNMIDRLKNLISYHDSPISTISYLVHSLISERISKTSSKVVVSGTGADELFTGYYDHYLFHFCEFKDKELLKRNINLWERSIKPLVRNKFLKDPNFFREDPDRRDNFYPDINNLSRFINIKFENKFPQDQFISRSILQNRLLNELFFETVPVILKEDDMNSMYYSLENRSPFLDKKLFETMLKVHPKDLIQDGIAKYNLRNSLKGILNEKVRLDKKKVGFNASIKNIFDFNLKSTREIFLDDSTVFKIFKKKHISNLIEQENINESEQKFLFNFINIKFFLQDQSF